MPSLNYALKEWSVAIDALAKGQSILLLRKGGIREQGGAFQVPYTQVLLYPTVEHQKLDQIRPIYQQQQSITTQAEPKAQPKAESSIQLTAWANIEKVFQLTQASQVQALEPFHIWTKTFINERLQWKKRHPLQALLLRVYRLETPVTLTWQQSFGGCRSWIDMGQTITATQSLPALDNQAYQQQYQAIISAL